VGVADYGIGDAAHEGPPHSAAPSAAHDDQSRLYLLSYAYNFRIGISFSEVSPGNWTVGRLDLSPGGINIIPGRVEFTLDLRDIDERVRDKVEQRIVGEARRSSEERDVGLDIDTLQRVAPVLCSDLAQNAATAACEEVGLEPYFLASAAGHDGMHLKDLCPVGMIFVRSKDGISHNPDEWSSQQDCVAGANVLYRTVLELTAA
jgi:allantoate deiminase